MTIDRSNEHWTGDVPDDIRGFLEAYATEGYEVHDFRLARCACGSLAFRLEADEDEGVARRTCTACAAEHFICDSEEYWTDADPEPCLCGECDADTVNIGVGFSMYENDPTGIRWLYVGVRCTGCGTLGCFTGWKVGMGDALYLRDRV